MYRTMKLTQSVYYVTMKFIKKLVRVHYVILQSKCEI